MTSPVITSQDYLQRLRERRQNKFSSPAPSAAVQPEAPQEPLVPEMQTVYRTPVFEAPQTPTAPVYEAPQAPPTEVTSAPEPAAQPLESAAPQEQTPAKPSTPTAAPIPENKSILEWVAPSRPFKKRNARFYTTITVIVVLISLILFFAGQFLPIAAVVAVAFLGYVLASVPPEKVTYELSGLGIKIDNAFYFWDEMGYFWMDKKYGQEFIQVEIPRFPFRLVLMLGDLPSDEMHNLFKELLPEQQPTLTTMDKIARWLEKNVLLDEA